MGVSQKCATLHIENNSDKKLPSKSPMFIFCKKNHNILLKTSL